MFSAMNAQKHYANTEYCYSTQEAKYVMIPEVWFIAPYVFIGRKSDETDVHRCEKKLCSMPTPKVAAQNSKLIDAITKHNH